MTFNKPWKLTSQLQWKLVNPVTNGPQQSARTDGEALFKVFLKENDRLSFFSGNNKIAVVKK